MNEYYRELQNKQVKCRKKHQCGWCGQRIERGDIVQYRAYIFDGLQNSWEHPECYEAMRSLPNDEIPQDGWSPGDFLRGSIEWA